MAKKSTVSSGRTPLLIAFALAGIFFVQGYSGLSVQSLTFDEPEYISAGYMHLTGNDFSYNPSHPPLLKEIIAFPLLFQQINRVSSVPPVVDPGLDFGMAFLFGSGNDPIRMGYWARLPILVIGSLLVLAVFLWGRGLYGDWPALAAAALAAVCPNLLAHSNLATTDLGCTAFMFFSVWSFWWASKEGRLRRWLLCGFVTGLALLTKYTALLLCPVYAILAVWLVANRRMKPAAAVKALAVAACVSLVVIGAGYNFTFDWHRYFGGMTRIYGDHGVNPNYMTYLLGKVSKDPWWYYNLVGLVTKTPIPTLLILLVAAWSCIAYRKDKGEAVVFSLVPASLMIFVSFFDPHNFGLRRILPAFPFLYLFAGHAFAGDRRRLRTAAVAVLLVWAGVEAAWIHPHYLSYFNEAAGGPEKGTAIFDESNVDWGQDLPELAKWQRVHPEAGRVSLAYFGTSDPYAYGVDAVHFDFSRAEHPAPGTYAVSAHDLVFLRKMHIATGADTDWLTKYKPVDRAGYSIYIYRF